jgi:hypothetical protein
VDGPDQIVRQFVYRGNLLTRGEYGFHGSRGMGRTGLETYCAGFEFTNNLIIGTGTAKDWPDGNRMAASLDAMRFENPTAGNYHLKPESPYYGSNAPGADMNQLSQATAGAISGVWR